MLDLFRTTVAAVRTLRGPRLALADTGQVTLPIVPADLDFFGHVTNARYLSLLNLGRADFLVRSGIARVAWKLRAPILVGHIDIRYLAPLKLGQRVLLETRLATSDEKWLVFEQEIRTGDRVATRARVQALFRNRTGNIAPEAMLQAASERAGHSIPPKGDG